MINRIVTIIMIILYCLIFFGAGFAVGHNDTLANKIMYNMRLFVYSIISWESTNSMDKNITVWTEDKDKKHNGLLLLGSYFINNPAIVLVDSKGEVLHTWNVEKKVFNTEVISKHRPHGKQEDQVVHGIEDVILFSDGSVIFTQAIYEFANYRSQRIAKIDKDSNVIWQTVGVWHHDMILAEDGNIYAVGSELSDTSLYIDQDKSKDSSFLRGIVSVISPEDGKVLKNISVEDAFLKSEYAHMLSLFTLDVEGVQEVILKDDSKLFDPIHINSVDYVTAKQAEKIPLAKEGDLLVSLRGPSTIALLRPGEEKIIWATRGSWRHQHYARITDEGKMMIYDNDGGASIGRDKGGKLSFRQQPRVVEFDPVTNKSEILFFNRSKEDMYSYWRGYHKVLDNGTMLVSSAEAGRVIQVDKKGKVIWELRTVAERDAPIVPYTKKIPSVKYYEKNYAKFLDRSSSAGNDKRDPE